jgi:hypothetical protein
VASSLKAGRKRTLTVKEGTTKVIRSAPRAFIVPQLATLVKKPPSGDKWLHEIKFDGYRIAARIASASFQTFTRKGLDWTDRFRPIAQTLSNLHARTAYLDGEIAVVGKDGVTSRTQRTRPPLAISASSSFARSRPRRRAITAPPLPTAAAPNATANAPPEATMPKVVASAPTDSRRPTTTLSTLPTSSRAM